MIRLRDILREGDEDKEERSVWRTFANRFGARNTIGQVRYFEDREDAAKFARGEIKGPKVGKPQKPKNKTPKERIQTYDYTPSVEKDMERVS